MQASASRRRGARWRRGSATTTFFCREIRGLYCCKILERAALRFDRAKPYAMFRQAGGVRPACSFRRAGGQFAIRGRATANKFQLTGSAAAPSWAAPPPIWPDRMKEWRHSSLRRADAAASRGHGAIPAIARLRGARPAPGKSHVSQARLAPTSRWLTPSRDADLSRGWNG